MGSDRYLASRQYQKPYSNPKPTRKYSRPPVERRGRGRLDRGSKPEYFQSPKPEKKYEAVLKPEKMSSPQVERAPRYTLGSRGPEAWIDTEDITKEVERKVEGRLTKQLLEKFGTELKELMKKVEKTSENSGSSAETRAEPRQEVERVERHAESDQGQRGDVESDRVESDGGSPEAAEDSKKDDVSLEGGFVFSRPFGLAIPTEVDEAELKQTENGEKIGEKQPEIESHENESGETKSQDRTEASEGKESENIEAQEQDEVETEKDSEPSTENSDEEGMEPEDSVEEKLSEEVNEENLEDVVIENLAEHEEVGEVVPKEITETEEVISEPLPEEGELYPVEEEPHDVEIV
jgi:hypothetical protein